MSIFSYKGIAPCIDPNSYVHKSATVIGQCTVGAGSSIWPSAVVRADNDKIVLGNNVNVQDGAVIHVDVGHPAVLKDNVSVGHLAMIHGATIGENTLIGMQAVILNDAVIGKNCIVGANTVVTSGKEIPDNSLVVGTPGKIIRQLTNEEIESNRKNAETYSLRSIDYKINLKELT